MIDNFDALPPELEELFRNSKPITQQDVDELAKTIRRLSKGHHLPKNRIAKIKKNKRWKR